MPYGIWCDFVKFSSNISHAKRFSFFFHCCISVEAVANIRYLYTVYVCYTHVISAVHCRVFFCLSIIFCFWIRISQNISDCWFSIVSHEKSISRSKIKTLNWTLLVRNVHCSHQLRNCSTVSNIIFLNIFSDSLSKINRMKKAKI